MHPLARRASGVGALMVAAWASLAAPALALDPSRSLTQYQNDQWQTDRGLPQSNVQALAQTRDGYLWVGTLDGLARFDGVRFTVFDGRTVPELGTGSILGLMEDRDGNLWIGRSGAAVVYRGGQFRVAFGDDVTEGKAVWSFCQGKDGAVWAATDGGLVRWDKGSLKVFRVADGLPTDRLRSVVIDRGGTLWIGTTGGGLVSYANGRFERLRVGEDLSRDEVRAVIADDTGVWAATAGGGLAHVVDGAVTMWTVANGLPTNQLSALALDAQGTLWLGTWGSGVCRLSAGRFSCLSANDGLTVGQVWSLFADREGGVWVGTWGGGLNRLRDRRFDVFGTPEGLSHDSARAVLHTRDGATWVATAGGGVNRIDGATVTTLRKKDGLPSDETSSLYEDRDGSLWIGTNTSGLARVSGGRISVFGTREGLPGTDVRAIYQDRSGTLWVATMSGLARSEGQGFVAVTNEGAPIEAVITILEDRTGTLWFATARSGLVSLRNGQFQVRTTKDGLASNRVMSLHEDDRGSLWIGTGGGGVTRLRDGQLKSILVADGLWDGFAQTILEDRLGNLWMTTNRGMFRTSREELDAFTDGRSPRVTSVGYGAADGLRNVTFAGGQSPAGSIDARGFLWLPTYKGLVIVDPANISASAEPPPVRFEEVTANGVTKEAGPDVVLAPGSGTLTIRYTAMTLVNAGRVRFRVRMDGLSNDWVDMGTRREALYPSLPHGDFLFRLAASTDGQTWREASAPLAVKVLPRPYETRWFFALVTVGIGAAAWTAYRMRTVQLVRRHREMERLVAEKTEALRRANEELSRLSFVDALTGLANRRRFDEALDEEWRRARRFGSPLALVMADVDGFKAFNDALGHPEGDRCLAAIAGVFLRSTRRAGDLAARYGGEEFAVLLPGLDWSSAEVFAEEVRHSVETLGIPHPTSPTGPVVTVSLGVAVCLPSQGAEAASLVADADAALYRAKKAGRNQTA